ncbi:MAG: HIT domain-containing protein [Fretibacterium sp.]|nr:HIT domain-containing protein [Fretibacterium sp.]
MKHLFATWRMAYISAPKHEGCIFCDFPAEHRDEERYILARGEECFLILNVYPYNPGHLMVVPYRHTNLYESLTDAEHRDMTRLSSCAVEMLKSNMAPGPDGFNVGMNLGRAAGAGVDGHLHLHIVPRWNGDNNFMPVLADTRVLPESLDATYRSLKASWERLFG